MQNSVIDTEQIMRNIYGVTATGKVENLTGGGAFKNYKAAILHSLGYNADIIESRNDIIRRNVNIRYIDDINANKMSYSMDTLFGGGGAKRKRKGKGKRKNKANASGENITIYASPEYVDNKDLKLFMDKFFLYYRFSRSPNSAIYVIPPSDVLNDMIKSRNNSLAEGSVEMQKDVRKNKAIGWEKYMFVTFGNNSTKDKYRIDPEINNKDAYPFSPFEKIRRTNINGEVYYFTYKDKKTVIIHNKPDNADDKSANNRSELTFVARFDNGGYIFQGVVPKNVSESIGAKPSKQNKRNKYKAYNDMMFGELPMFNDDVYNENQSVIKGGSVSNLSLKTLEQYDNLYKGDHDLAAEHFLRCVAKYDPDGFKQHAANNADFVYSAVIYSLNKPNNIKPKYVGKEVTTKSFRNFYNNYSIKNNASIDTINNIKYNIAKKVKENYDRFVIGGDGELVNKNYNTSGFIESFKYFYRNNKNDLVPAADVITSYIRNTEHPDIDRVSTEVVDAIVNNAKPSYGVCSIINNGINNCFAPSMVGKMFMPVFNDILDSENFETLAKRNSRRYNEENNTGGTEDRHGEDSGPTNIAKEIFSKETKNVSVSKEEQEDFVNDFRSDDDDEVIITNNKLSDDDNIVNEFDNELKFELSKYVD